jgi:hypothetical protein
MRRIADRLLWIGHAGDLRDARSLMDLEPQAIVELADHEPLAILPRELLRFRFPLSDGGENAVWLLRLAIESTASLLRQRVPTVICCSAGMSRSVCIAAAGIARAEERSLEEAIRIVVNSGPVDVSPGLLVQVRLVMAS